MRTLTYFFLIILFTTCSRPNDQVEETSSKYDVIFRNGIIVDGLGNPGFKGDLAVKDDLISTISRDTLDSREADLVIDVGGQVISPGFIDNHAHIQSTIHEHPLAENFIRQGITTIMATLHSHDQPWPLDEYASSLVVAPNIGFFSGHTWTRKQVLGLENVDPSEEELEKMKWYVEETMKQGALGFSTGLLYIPGNYAETEEVIELAKVASEYGGIYVTHMRNEATGLLNSVKETIRIAAEANIPAQINHHKASGIGQWGWSEKSLALIDSANEAGLDIKHDLYPYTASSTYSSILFPQWALAGGKTEFARRMDNADERSRIEEDMKRIFMTDRTGSDLKRIQFRVLPFDQSYNGKRLADYARDLGMPNNLETGIKLAIDLELKGGFTAIYHSMDEKDVIRILQHPLAMIDTDGDPVSYGVGYPHPRSYGAFPRILARYVRELDAITLEEAIKKMTSMPADQFNQPRRGRLKEGMYADIVVFNPETIEDKATFVNPHQYAVGIDHVMINGKFVLKGGALTGEKPGQWLKGPARP